MPTNDPRSIGKFILAAARRFEDERGFQIAASLAFTTLLAIVPVITVALALASAYPLFDRLVDALRSLAVGHLLPQTGGVEAITEQLAEFRANAARLTAIGLGLILVSALMLLLTVDGVFNRIYRVSRPRPLAGRVLAYLLVLLLGPLLIGGSITITTYLLGHSLGMVREIGGLARAALAAMPFAFSFVALALLYKLVPSRRVAARHAIIGAVFAAVTFEIAKRAFAWYIVQFPTYAMIYGAFAVLPIFLLWVYVSWVVVLGGAILTALLGEREAAA